VDWLLAASIERLHEGFMAGAVTAVQVAEFYRQRISAAKPLNAVRESSSRVMSDAAELDRRIEAGGGLAGPLHGVALLLKDNIETADGMECTAGALAFAGYRPERDAYLVRRLRSAGALILGKTNMTELADYVSDTMPSEFSAVGGIVRHPFGLRFDRGGGSSVGSAAAVAAGLCHAAIGSETQNSILSPAAAVGITGFKPSVGRVSRSGVVPLVASQDTAGVLARTVSDAAAIVSAMEGPDVSDCATLIPRMQKCARQNSRVGLITELWAAHLPLQGAMHVFVRSLATVGLEPVLIDEASSVTAMGSRRSSVFGFEVCAGLDHFLAIRKLPSGVRSLADLVEFNVRSPNAIPYGQSLLEAALGTQGDLSHPTYQADRARDLALSSAIIAMMDDQRLGAMLVPGAAMAKFSGKAGAPALTVPAPFEKRVGAATTLVAPPGCDDNLVQLALKMEQLNTFAWAQQASA
jgi:amidase